MARWVCWYAAGAGWKVRYEICTDTESNVDVPLTDPAASSPHPHPTHLVSYLPSSTSLPHDRRLPNSQAPLIAPQSLRPKTAEDTRITPDLLADTTNACHLENPIDPCRTCRARPIAGLEHISAGRVLLYAPSFSSCHTVPFYFSTFSPRHRRHATAFAFIFGSPPSFPLYSTC